MAFQNLKVGSTVYAFYKSTPPRFETGQVSADPEIKLKYPMPTPGQPYNPGFMTQPQEQVVNLAIRFGDKIQPIACLNPTADIQDCGNGLFISCNREAINAEIVAYKQISEMALAPQTLSAHKQVVEGCNEILSKINPEIAERQRLEEENKKLRDEITAIKSETSEVKGMLTSLLAQLGSSGA